MNLNVAWLHHPFLLSTHFDDLPASLDDFSIDKLMIDAVTVHNLQSAMSPYLTVHLDGYQVEEVELGLLSHLYFCQFRKYRKRLDFARRVFGATTFACQSCVT